MFPNNHFHTMKTHKNSARADKTKKPIRIHVYESPYSISRTRNTQNTLNIIFILLPATTLAFRGPF